MKPSCDIAILGSGMGGAILGAILARNGARVTIIDKGSHPRFAIGESTIPQTTVMLKVLAERFGVPELHNISSFDKIARHVTPSCGIKLMAGFVYHRKNRDLDPLEANQSATGHEETHFFRQEIDSYLLGVAARYGCKVYQNTNTEKIDIGSGGVRIGTNRGEATAKFVVDGTGYNSVLAKMFDLRNSGDGLARTHSRALFTHMINVPHFEDVVAGEIDHGMPTAWSKGTLHHLFERGWMWVIPFDNHERSSSKLCSVGLMLDPRRHPKENGVSPEEEFFSFIEQYPRVRAQFRNARAVREWVSSGRINYSSRVSVGYRFALLSHSCGFVDPLFSRGMCNTVEGINIIAGTLLKALDPKDGDYGDFSVGRLSKIEEMQAGLVSYNDTLVNCSYISLKDYDLWNAYYRVWLLMALYGYFRVARAYFRYLETGDKSVLASLEEARHPGCVTSNDELWRIFSRSSDLVEGTEPIPGGCRRYTSEQAAGGIFEMLRSSNAYPAYLQDLANPTDRCTHAGQFASLKFRNWLQQDAPEDLKSEYFDFDPATSILLD